MHANCESVRWTRAAKKPTTSPTAPGSRSRMAAGPFRRRVATARTRSFWTKGTRLAIAPISSCAPNRASTSWRYGCSSSARLAGPSRTRRTSSHRTSRSVRPTRSRPGKTTTTPRSTSSTTCPNCLLICAVASPNRLAQALAASPFRSPIRCSPPQ